MPRIHVRGYELRAIGLSEAKVADVIELQHQSGLKLKDIHAQVAEADALGLVVQSFLTQRNAGMEPSWDALKNGSMSDLGRWVPEPGDLPKAETEPDPQKGSTGTPDVDDAAATESTPHETA